MHRPTLAALAGLAAAALLPAPVRAHFVLLEPESYAEQNILGDPQKAPPCGQGGLGHQSPPTGAVTTVEEGSVLRIDILETIYHPGHYRVAIAADEASLPDTPPVTPGTTPCGSTVIDAAPALPVLADGLLVHTKAFVDEQAMEVQLPPGFTCDGCLLQVVQFMSNHALNNPGGCFYHHCATVNVVPAGSLEPDAGGGTEPDAAADPDPDAGADPDPGPAPDAAAADTAPADDTAPAPDGASPDTAPGPSAPAAGSSGGGCAHAPGAPGDAALPLALAAAALALARRRRPASS